MKSNVISYKLKRFSYILVFIGVVMTVLVSVSSCKKNCYSPSRSLAGVLFVDSVTRKAYTVKNLTVKAIDNDTILYNNVSVSAVYLPLHLSKNETTYTFTVVPATEGGSAVTYNLTLYHRMEPQFVSPECGCVPTYLLDSVKVDNNAAFKKMELYNKFVQNIEQDAHVKIYY